MRAPLRRQHLLPLPCLLVPIPFFSFLVPSIYLFVCLSSSLIFCLFSPFLFCLILSLFSSFHSISILVALLTSCMILPLHSFFVTFFCSLALLLSYLVMDSIDRSCVGLSCTLLCFVSLIVFDEPSLSWGDADRQSHRHRALILVCEFYTNLYST